MDLDELDKLWEERHKGKKTKQKTKQKETIVRIKDKNYKIKKSGFKVKHYTPNTSRLDDSTPFKTSTFKQLVLGGTGSGKTNWVLNVIKNYLALDYFDIENVYIFSPNQTDLLTEYLPIGYQYYDNLFDLDEETQTCNLEDVWEEIKERTENRDDEETEGDANSHRSLIIFDDMLPELIRNHRHPIITSLLTKDYHVQTSIMIVSQLLSKALPTTIKKGITSVALLRNQTAHDINCMKRYYMSTSHDDLYGLYKRVTSNNKKYGKKIRQKSNPLVWIRDRDLFLDGFDPIESTS
jgi:hypothetical protein